MLVSFGHEKEIKISKPRLITIR